MKIMITGHRPSSLSNDYGYDYHSGKWKYTIQIFKELLIRYKATEAITGMALGADTAFAIAVLELKKSGYDLKLHCAIPCLNHSSKWPEKSRELYHSILRQADLVQVVSEESYQPRLMQIRNEYMVDHSDLLIAFWNGEKGGTKNCIDYAKKQFRPMIWIEP